MKKLPHTAISFQRVLFLSFVSFSVFAIFGTVIFGYFLFGTPFGFLNLLDGLVYYHNNPYPYTSDSFSHTVIKKPAIYLYPKQIQETLVHIEYAPGFSVTYPDYRDGWHVTAYPDGHLIDMFDGKEYSYLYWEGNKESHMTYDMTNGFVIPKENIKDFLQTELSEMGLIPKEYNEFIVYWLPHLLKYDYTLLHFATDSEYGTRVPMTIDPAPDSVLRILMVFKKADPSVSVTPQSFPQFKRNGFTVVEWGGVEL